MSASSGFARQHRAKNIVVKLLGGRAASAVIGLFMLAIGSSAATRKPTSRSLSREPASARSPADRRPWRLPRRRQRRSSRRSPRSRSPSSSRRRSRPRRPGSTRAAGRSTRWSTSSRPMRRSTSRPTALRPRSISKRAARAVEGQLAVARVVMNRAASGRYPPDWCSVVKQPAQFSFVRHGEFPYADTNSDAWQQGRGGRRARGRQRRAERQQRRALVPRRLCRSVLGPPPAGSPADRRAHLLPRLTRVNLEG